MSSILSTDTVLQGTNKINAEAAKLLVGWYKPIAGQILSSSRILAASTEDVYTCPTGKNAVILAGSAYWLSGTTSTLRYEINNLGSYRPIAGAVAGTGPFMTNINRPNMPILAGGVVRVVGAIVGSQTTIRLFEYDPADMKAIYQESLSVGDNLLYTVPAGRRAFVRSQVISNLNSQNTVSILNMSGSTAALQMYINRGSKEYVSATNSPVSTVTGFTGTQITQMNFWLTAGQSLGVTTNVAGTFIVGGFAMEEDV